VAHPSFKKRGGRASRRKGALNERALVRYLQDHGFAAEKSSRTGYTGHDLTVPVLGVDRRVEVKVRANGFRELYGWLNGADLLIVRSDRHEPLVVLPLRLAAEVAAVAERHKANNEASSSVRPGGQSPFVTHLPLGEA
jgi:Holliday junction resolvase